MISMQRKKTTTKKKSLTIHSAFYMDKKIIKQTKAIQQTYRFEVKQRKRKTKSTFDDPLT